MLNKTLQNDSASEIYVVGFWGRMRFAIKAAWAIISLRPIFVSFDDEEMYARTNVILLAKMAGLIMNVVDTLSSEQDGEQYVEDILRYTNDRMN